MALSRGSLIVVLALLPAAVQAQAAPVPEVGGSLLQLLVSLAVVLVLIFGSLWLLKNLAAPRGQGAGLLRVVAGTAVGSRERVVVLEVGATWLVLGVAPGRVTALAEVPRQAVPAAAESRKDFAAWLKQVVERRRAR